MAIAGDTTATLAAAGSYQPPFTYYGGAPQQPMVTGTTAVIAGPNPTSGGTPTVIPTTSGPRAYATAYLTTHMMSWPSYRYAYLFWVCMAGIALLYGLAHHLRLSGGSIGAQYNKWGMRRATLGRKTGRRSTLLPSNSVCLTAVILVAIPALLATLGTDYIHPSKGVWDFTNTKPKHSISTNKPQYNIVKSIYTSANRFGFMVFAMLPLVILFALKAPPVAVLSLKWFTHLYADKLATFHRVLGWLVWAMTTVHVVLWTLQLFQDQWEGRGVWFTMFYVPRFIFGIISYAMMTALMVLSLRPIRKAGYEFFYISHCVLVVGTLVFAALHHPVLWFWIVGSLGLWMADRVWRALRYARINAGASKAKQGPEYKGLATDDIVLEEFTDKMVSRPGYDSPTYGRGFDSPNHGRGSEDRGYAQGEIIPTGSYDSAYNDNSGLSTPNPDFHNHRPVSMSPSVATFQTARGLPEYRPPSIPAGFAHAQLLPSRTVRLTINTPRPIRWQAGQTVLLTIPELSRFQSHPFTMCNNNPREMVLLVKARKGMTRQLYDLVRKRSEQALSNADKQGTVIPKADPVFIKVGLDGPMGSAGRVRWANYSTVLLICGGSGISFGLAVCDYVTQLIASGAYKTHTKRIRFVWVAREYAEIAWAASALCRAKAAVKQHQLDVDIYVTSAPSAPTDTPYDDLAPPRPGYAHDMTRPASTDSLQSEYSRTGNDDEATSPTWDWMAEEMQATGADLQDLTNYEEEEDTHDPKDSDFSRQIQKQGKMRRARARRKEANANAPISNPYRDASDGASPLSGQPSPALPSPSGVQDPFVNPSPRTSSRGLANQNTPPLSQSHFFTEKQRNSRNVSGYSVTSDGQGHVTSPGGGYTDDQMHLTAPGPFSESNRRYSSRSLASSTHTYDRYDPFTGGGGISPSPSMVFDDADSARYTMSLKSRTQSMILLEDTAPHAPRGKRHASGASSMGTAAASSLWIDEADYAATSILSESARGGRPQLPMVLKEEMERAEGSIIVATCGPNKLNAVVRNLVSRSSDPRKILQGDQRGNVAIYSEDFE